MVFLCLDARSRTDRIAGERRFGCPVECPHDIEPKRDGDLIVSRAPRVDGLSHLAEPFREFSLYKGMNVLAFRIDSELPFPGFGKHGFQRGAYGLGFFHRKDALTPQHAGMGDRAFQILTKESRIHGKRRKKNLDIRVEPQPVRGALP